MDTLMVLPAAMEFGVIDCTVSVGVEGGVAVAVGDGPLVGVRVGVGVTIRGAPPPKRNPGRIPGERASDKRRRP
jgi:hypothetical protein